MQSYKAHKLKMSDHCVFVIHSEAPLYNEAWDRASSFFSKTPPTGLSTILDAVRQEVFRGL